MIVTPERHEQLRAYYTRKYQELQPTVLMWNPAQQKTETWPADEREWVQEQVDEYLSALAAFTKAMERK
jgi:hypothetical protein